MTETPMLYGARDMWAYSFYGVEFDKLPEEDKKKVIAYIAKSLLKQGENNE